MSKIFLNTEYAETTEKKEFSMKHRCPICKAETDSAVHADFPFCSERCRLFDLGKWASGEYVIPAPITDEDEIPNFPEDAGERE